MINEVIRIGFFYKKINVIKSSLSILATLTKLNIEKHDVSQPWIWRIEDRGKHNTFKFSHYPKQEGLITSDFFLFLDIEFIVLYMTEWDTYTNLCPNSV